MEETENLETMLVEKTDEGKIQLVQAAECLLDACEENLEKATQDYERVKQALINAMLDNNIKTSQLGKYKLAVREPKDKWTFDEHAFIKNESEELVKAFATVKTNVTETFDIEKFKAEYPEVYAKYLTRKEEDELVIDENKLWSNLRNVWEKYATKEPGKAPTISIKKVGE